MVQRIALFLLLISSLSQAQDSTQIAEKKTKKFRFLPLPAFGANPTVGFLFGVAPGAYWTMGNPSNTSLSNALGTVIFTTKKQTLLTLKANSYFSGDKWSMVTDLRYFITSQPTYGLGTGPQSAKPVGTGFAEYSDNPYSPIESEQMMDFNFLRIHNTVMKKYKQSRFFMGIGYHLDYHFNIEDNLLKLDTVPQIVTSHYAYCTVYDFDPEKYTTSGLSLNFSFDSRDNAVNPYSGRYANANIHINSEFLGSTKNSSLLWLEYRDYIHLNKERPRHLIGLWTYGMFSTSGVVPYLDLPAVGWDLFGRSGRAYTQGRFRGQNLIYTELEYRVPLQQKKEMFGAVAFINGTTATNKDGNISLYEYVDIGYGIGLRVMINKITRANINIDYAFGKYGAQGFYFGLNEVF